MVRVLAALPFLFAPLVFAQSANNELAIEAIEAHYTGSGIVPALLSEFTPSALLHASFAGVGDISPGQALAQSHRLCFAEAR